MNTLDCIIRRRSYRGKYFFGGAIDLQTARQMQQDAKNNLTNRPLVTGKM